MSRRHKAGTLVTTSYGDGSSVVAEVLRWDQQEKLYSVLLLDVEVVVERHPYDVAKIAFRDLDKMCERCGAPWILTERKKMPEYCEKCRHGQDGEQLSHTIH